MDSFYNASAARWAREAVMKMDDDTARSFVTAATHSILMEDIANNRRTLDGHILEIQKSLHAAASRVVSKSGTLTPVRVVEEVHKAFGDDKFTRDERGRFSTAESRVRTNRARRPYDKDTERAEGIPSAKEVAQASGGPGRPVKGRKLTPAERAAYQQQYLQLVEFMDRYSAQGVKNPEMVLEDKTTGRRRAVPVSFQGDVPQGWNPSRQNIVAVRAAELNTAGGASFDLVSALGSQRAGGVAGDFTEGVQRGNSAFQERWHSEGTPGTNKRTYRRIEAGSQLLGQVAPNSAKAQVASQFGEFVGQFGPEAEKVVGPHLRKTTYRYRGTERKPDAALIQERNIRVQRLEVPESDQSVAQIAARRAGVGSTVSAEQKAMASVQTATGYLMNRVPSIRLSEIQRKSGKIPPSEGVIIDAEGKIATQAVGYADDHYLPFNLKNLQSLKGGEYVRTRTKGGLTTEDIYTGLVSGARQVTVVSNSGVFTIEFEDDFRGVRRYNDKAASMVDRYAKTLDAIQGGQIEREPIDPAVKAEIREEVETRMPRDMGYTSADVEEAIQTRIREYRETPSLTTNELNHIDQQARETGKNEGDVRRLRSQLTDAALEKKANRMYQLDGQGYAAAIESMKEQYPYYIKSVSFMNKREAMDAEGNRTDPNNAPDNLSRFSGAKDQGYVKSRHNRPTEVQAGYYDKTITGRGKQSAADTNYQNWSQNPNNRRRNGQVEEEAEERQVGGGTLKRVPAADRALQAQARLKVEAGHKDALKSLNDHLSGVDIPKESYPTMHKARENFDAVWGDPADREALEKELTNAWDALKQLADDPSKTTPVEYNSTGRAKVEALKTAAGRTGGKEWKPEFLGVPGAQPYAFKGEAYEPGASEKVVRKEINRLELELKDAGIPNTGKMPPEVLGKLAASSGQMAKTLQSGTLDQRGSEALASLAEQLGAKPGWHASMLERLETTEHPEAEAKKWAGAAQNLERMRRIITNTPPTPDQDVKVRSRDDAPTPKQITNVRDQHLPSSGPSKERTMAQLVNQGGLLEIAGRHISDKPTASAYQAMANYLKRGEYMDALEIASELRETDSTRRNLLTAIFPEIDPDDYGYDELIIPDLSDD